MKKLLAIIVLGLLLVGCASAPVGWGGKYDGVQSNSESITIRYDTLIGSGSIYEPATAHCSKFDKQPVPTTKSFQAQFIAIQVFECR